VISPDGIVYGQEDLYGGTPSVEKPMALSAFEFHGGSLTEFIKGLKVGAMEQSLPEFNVVINDMDGASEVRMPPLALRKVTVDSTMQLIPYLVASEDHAVQMKTLHQDSPDCETYMVMLKKLKQPRNDAANPKSTLRIYSVSNWMQRTNSNDPQIRDALVKKRDKSLETVLTAIDTGLQMIDSSREKDAVIRFHSESNLIFAKATLDEHEVINAIIEQTARTSEQEAVDIDEFIRMDYGDRLEKALKENAGLKKNIAELQSRLAEMEKKL